MNAGLISFQQEIMPSQQGVRHAPLKPELRYLLVQSEGREALMVWVGIDRTPLCEASVWVSADGVVMRLCNGRLIGVSEPKRQWQLIDESKPLAVDPLIENHSLHEQTTDQQPGFHLGIVRLVEKRKLTHQDQSIHWIEEIDHHSGVRLSWYAENLKLNWMAGQRCMTPDWCLQWQTWPEQPPAPLS